MLTSSWRVVVFMICLLTNLKCLAQETVPTLRLHFIKVLT